jgi:hypothetical protein
MLMLLFKEPAYNASAKDISTHEESQLTLTAGTIQNNRIHPALGRLNPELNSPPSPYLSPKYLHGYRIGFLISRHEQENQISADLRLL